MNPLLHSVAGQAINDQFCGDGAGNDADALAHAQDAEQRKNTRRQCAKRADCLGFESVERNSDAGVRDHGNAESDKNTPSERANEIYQHAANCGDENRHFLSPCDYAKREQKRDRDQQVTEVFEIRIDHRKGQCDGLAPYRYVEVRNTSRASGEGVA